MLLFMQLNRFINFNLTLIFSYILNQWCIPKPKVSSQNHKCDFSFEDANYRLGDLVRFMNPVLIQDVLASYPDSIAARYIAAMHYIDRSRKDAHLPLVEQDASGNLTLLWKAIDAAPMRGSWDTSIHVRLGDVIDYVQNISLHDFFCTLE